MRRQVEHGCKIFGVHDLALQGLVDRRRSGYVYEYSCTPRRLPRVGETARDGYEVKRAGETATADTVIMPVSLILCRACISVVTQCHHFRQVDQKELWRTPVFGRKVALNPPNFQGGNSR